MFLERIEVLEYHQETKSSEALFYILTKVKTYSKATVFLVRLCVCLGAKFFLWKFFELKSRRIWTKFPVNAEITLESIDFIGADPVGADYR